MSKISARGIQLFVAGAVALNGFDSLFWMFYYLFYVRDSVQVIAHLIGGLMLPLGIGILIGSARAIRLTVIYLWVVVFMIVTGVPIFCYFNPAKARVAIWENTLDLLVSLSLLWLLWRSRRTSNTAPEPAPSAPSAAARKLWLGK
jgi:hypothetical protein